MNSVSNFADTGKLISHNWFLCGEVWSTFSIVFQCNASYKRDTSFVRFTKVQNCLSIR